MKTCDNKNHWDMSKREFYDSVKRRKDELEEVIDKAKECKGYVDFDTWYTQEYEWRFLNDILGGQKQMGVAPFDYCNLIHVPVMVWKDAEGNEHRVKFMGEHDIEYYGLFSPYSFKDYGPDKTLTTDEEGKIVWATGSGTWGKIAGNVHDQTDVQARVIYSVSEPVEKYDNDIWVNEAEAGGGTGTLDYNMLHNKPSIAGVELTGNKTLEQLDLYSRKEVNDKISTESAHYIANPADKEGRWNNIEELENFTKEHPELISNNDYAIVMQITTGSEIVIYGRWKFNGLIWAKEYDFTGDITALTAQVKENTEEIANNIYKKYTSTSEKTKTTYSAEEIDLKIEGISVGKFLGTYEGTASEIANPDIFIKEKLFEAGQTYKLHDYVYINETGKYVYYKYKYNGSEFEFIIAIDLSSTLTIDMIYPVGSIYMSTNSTNPGILFSGTTWNRIENDTYLISGNYTGSTIGANEKSVPLLRHSHNKGSFRITGAWSGYETSGYNDGAGHNYARGAVTFNNPGGYNIPNYRGNRSGDDTSQKWYMDTNGTDENGNPCWTGTTSEEGTSNAKINVQPKSLQVYMWTRTL